MSVEGTTAAVTAPHRRRRFNPGLDRFSGLYLWAGFILLFGLWVPSSFLTLATLHGVATEQAVAGMIALALLVPLSAGIYDLSVGQAANCAGILSVILIDNNHWATVPAVLAGIALGFGIGVVNATIVVGFGVNSFIATLGTTSILTAVETMITSNQQPLPPTPDLWNNLTQQTVGGFQIIVLYLLVLAFVLWWLMSHTPAGRYLNAIGGNADSARLSGVRVERWTIFALLTSATLSGAAGVLFVSQNGPALQFGPTLLLPAFAAAFLGSTQLVRNKFNIWGTLIAIYVLATGVQGLQLVSGAVWINNMFNGGALIIAVGLSVGKVRPFAWVRARLAARRRTQSGGGDAGTVTATPP